MKKKMKRNIHRSVLTEVTIWKSLDSSLTVKNIASMYMFLKWTHYGGPFMSG